MKHNRIVYAVLTVFAILGVAATLHAAVVSKQRPLNFVRTSTNGTQVTQLSDGNHPNTGANAGVAVGVVDTTEAFDISDAFAKQAALQRNGFNVGSSLPSDSLLLGSLVLDGTSSTIDSIVVKRDISADGFNWTSVDSLTLHGNGQTQTGFATAGGDSLLIVGSSVTNPQTGAVTKRGTVVIFSYPSAPSTSVTALGVSDVLFQRFRIHMTAGDFAAAGTSNGVRATWVYPSWY